MNDNEQPQGSNAQSALPHERPSRMQRRRFMQTAVATSSAALAMTGSQGQQLLAADINHTAPPRKLLKTLKIGMVRVEGGLEQKFAAAKAAGFDGIELAAPGINVEETKRAIDATGLPVDGSVGATHWNTTHSNPDPSVRAQALSDLQNSIRETHAVGGHSVLLVVGVGGDGSEREVWDRSIANIRKALPLCGELGMSIVIENVWNRFCYEHDGPNNQSADKFIEYVDEFESPWVGMQFDIGNHWKYGNPAEWIRALGRRIVKFDIKGFSRATDSWKDITEDDIPWADVRQAIDDIGFYGWIAAEVGGGGPDRLATIAGQMDRALNIG